MENFLMSSPSHNNNNTINNSNNNSHFNDNFPDSTINFNDFTNDFDDSDLSHLVLDSSKSWTENFPSLLENNENNNNNNIGSIHNHNHSITNVFSHRAKNSIVDSLNAAPTLTHSHSIESIPQLSSSLSNQSLDSPNSYQKHNNQLFLNNSTTPRRPSRHNSLSANLNLHTNSNVYSTPLKSNQNQQSPINLITSKVIKTPHTNNFKKSHSRSRSKLSIDFNSNSYLNPFYTPSNNSFISPPNKVYERDDTSLLDPENNDVGTPLPTPGSQRVGHNNLSGSNTMFSPVNNLSNQPKVTNILKRNDTLESIKIEDQDDDAFMQLRKAKSFNSIPLSGSRNNITSLTNLPPSSNINSTKLSEDQHPNFLDPQNYPNFFNAADLSLRLANHLSNDEVYVPNNSTSNVFFGDSSQYPNDMLQQNLQQFNAPPNQNINLIGKLINVNKNLLPGKQLTPQEYTQQQFSNFQQQHLYQQQQQQQLHQLGRLYPVNHPHSAPEIQFKSAGIDLLSGQFISLSNFNENIDKFSESLTTNLKHSRNKNPFKKSYPASIDLASITTNPVNSSLSAPPTFKPTYQQNHMALQRGGSFKGSSNLLPPMATFSTPQQNLQDTNQLQQQLDQNQFQHNHFQQQLQQEQSQQQIQQQQVQPHQQHQLQQPELQQVQNELHEDKSMLETTTQPQLPIKSAPMSKSVRNALLEPNFSVDIPIVKSNRVEKTDKVDPKKTHKCPICDARFQRPEHVKRHLKSHSSEKPYQCEEPDCGKRFNRKDNLKAHLKKIHHKKV